MVLFRVGVGIRVNVRVRGKNEGGSLIDMVYVYVPASWGAFSRNLV